MLQPERGNTVSPTLKPYHEGYLSRPGQGNHKLYFAEYGNPQGKPLLAIHGTALPFTPDQFQFISNNNIRLIVFHQRGVGKSQPAGEILENSIPHTLKDIEALRQHLQIEKWGVFGWSLGSTIATLYAQKHTAQCNCLLLTGLFLARPTDYVTTLLADYDSNRQKWENLSKLVNIPLSEQSLPEITDRLYERFCSSDKSILEEAMRAWLGRSTNQPITPTEKNYLRVNFHYKHGDKTGRFFVNGDNLIHSIPKISKIATVIVKGNNDSAVPQDAGNTFHDQNADVVTLQVDDDHFYKLPETQKALARIASTLLK